MTGVSSGILGRGVILSSQTSQMTRKTFVWTIMFLKRTPEITRFYVTALVEGPISRIGLMSIEPLTTISIVRCLW